MSTKRRAAARGRGAVDHAALWRGPNFSSRLFVLLLHIASSSSSSGVVLRQINAVTQQRATGPALCFASVDNSPHVVSASASTRSHFQEHYIRERQLPKINAELAKKEKPGRRLWKCLLSSLLGTWGCSGGSLGSQAFIHQGPVCKLCS